MNYRILLIFLIIKPPANALENATEKIIKARVNLEEWEFIENEERNNELDLFSGNKVNDKELEIVAMAKSSTMEKLKQRKIGFNVLVPNVDKMLEETPQRKGFERAGLISNHTITFSAYLTYEEIVQYLEFIPTLSTEDKKISVVSIGKTLQNKSILMVKIEHKRAKNIMFYDSGAHAREWLTVMTAMYLIDQLVQEFSHTAFSEMNWYIIPCLNPDGYVYSQSSSKYRLHRKNLNTKNCSKCKRCGVDVNRNFGYKFGVGGSSPNPCSIMYQGQGPFSEPESKALRNILLEYTKDIKLYLSLHSWGKFILYPWGYDKIQCDDWADLEKAAKVAKKAIEQESEGSTVYKIASAGKDIYVAAGISSDYAKSIGIKYSFTMEIQGGGSTGFDPPSSDIKNYVIENFAGLTALAVYINDEALLRAANYVDYTYYADAPPSVRLDYLCKIASLFCICNSLK